MSKLFLTENTFNEVYIPMKGHFKFVAIDTGEKKVVPPEVFINRYSMNEDPWDRIEVSMLIGDKVGIKTSYRELINLYSNISSMIEKINHGMMQ